MSPHASSLPTEASPGASPGVLLLTDDPALVADVQRLAAAAGSSVTVGGATGRARAAWPTASLVLVGADLLAAVAAGAPPRRERVHVVARGTMPDVLFRAALEVGADTVVELPAADAWLVETLADVADGPGPAGQVVGVVGGCGGAGATTFATALAMAAASFEQPVTLVDADPLGAGVERVVGLDDPPGAGWASLQESAGRLGSRALRTALPQVDGLAVLGWEPGGRDAPAPQVVREVLSAARRGSRLVVVDLPRHRRPETDEALTRCDDLVLVVPSRVEAVAAAVRVAAHVVPLVPRAHLVTRGPASALDPEEVAGVLGVPLVAAMSDQRRLAESVELGLGPLPGRRGPLVRAVRETLRALGVAAVRR